MKKTNILFIDNKPNEINFCAMNMKNKFNDLYKESVLCVSKRNYDFFLFLNKIDIANDNLPYLFLPNGEKYFAFNINHSNKKLSTKIIFVDIFNLFSDDIDNDFFIWLTLHVNDKSYEHIYVVSDIDPFFFFYFKYRDANVYNFINIMINSIKTSINYITAYDKMYKYDMLLMIWPEITKKIRLIYVGDFKIQKKNKYESVMKTQALYINEGFLSITSTSNDVSYISTSITMYEIINYIVNKIIILVSDIKKNGFAYHKIRAMRKYDEIMMKYSQNQISQDISDRKNIRMSILRKNLLNNIIEELENIYKKYSEIRILDF